MGKIRTVKWARDPHTAAKHEILRQYLCAWIPILGRFHEMIVYIDGFAGPGEYEGGESGSPIIAMEIARGFADRIRGRMTLLFIEADAPRLEHLKGLVAQIEMPANVLTRTRLGRFEDHVRNLVAARDTLPPTFVLIDPFGFSHTPIDVIARLLA